MSAVKTGVGVAVREWVREQARAETEKAAGAEPAGAAAGGGRRNLMQRAGCAWRVRFEGRPEFFVWDTVGVRYVDYLVHHPSQPIRAFELERRILPEKGAIRSGTGVREKLDPDTMKRYLREVERLRAEREQAADDGQEGETMRLDGEIEAMEGELERLGTKADAGSRARDNVRKAIDGLVRKLARGDEGERALAAHIRQFVSLGYEVLYTRTYGEVWA
jgi:hypothetical protein